MTAATVEDMSFQGHLFGWNPPTKSLSATERTDNTEPIKWNKSYFTSFASDCQRAVSSGSSVLIFVSNGAEHMTKYDSLVG